MQLKNFFYELPEQLIAQEPLVERAQARLMVVHRRTKKITHARFGDIGDFLPARCILVVNNSKVIPARLLGTKERSGGKVEIFLLRKRNHGLSFDVLMKPMRKIKQGDRIKIDGSKVLAEVTDREARIVKFSGCTARDLADAGHMPLPPYIKRPDQPVDRRYYQTVYARPAGSVAAPTAGLHFTKPLIDNLKKAGHDVVALTLHVNYATFKPVEEEDITRHKMHREEYVIAPRVFSTVTKARQEGRKIVAVGTTSCRVIEAVAHGSALKGETDIFIYPGFVFKGTDVLITNFHFPYSSLLMLVYAFGSTELMRKAYQEAIRQKYRFYSYGDAMIIV